MLVYKLTGGTKPGWTLTDSTESQSTSAIRFSCFNASILSSLFLGSCWRSCKQQLCLGEILCWSKCAGRLEENVPTMQTQQMRSKINNLQPSENRSTERAYRGKCMWQRFQNKLVSARNPQANWLRVAGYCGHSNQLMTNKLTTLPVVNTIFKTLLKPLM